MKLTIKLAARSAAIILLAVTTLLSACQEQSEATDSGGLTVSDASVRLPVAGGDVSSAYLTIRNKGVTDRELLSASSPHAKTIEIHEHIHAEGSMRMRQLPALGIPAGSTATLESGGTHLMLFQLDERLRDKRGGTLLEVPLSLHFDNDETVTVHARLKSVLD